jgi:copper chaperone NosL
MRRLLALVIAGAALALAGCDNAEVAKAPPPAKLTRDATGHYCRMIVLDHKGPKGQIHIAGKKKPVWFSSVRDTVAFTMLPEEPKRITAIYVNDMTDTPWDRPGPDTWIDAKKALYVIGSSKRGGMGAAEAVPFKGEAAAKAFAAKFGGRVVAFDKIPRKYILGESGTAPSYDMNKGGGHEGHEGHNGAPNTAEGGHSTKMPMKGGTENGDQGDQGDHGKHEQK